MYKKMLELTDYGSSIETSKYLLRLPGAMFGDLTFLEEGAYTQRDDVVRNLAQELQRSIIKDPWNAVRRYVAEDLRLDESQKEEVFRRRTASQILASKYVTGCTDVALAFIVLARALGIPTRYVETFNQDWLSDFSENGIHGHIFVDVLVDGAWRAYEPTTGFTPNNEYRTRGGKHYVEVGKGLDFSAVYIRENSVYRPEPVNLQSFDEALRIFKPSALRP